jgi:hypothetical protein
MTHLAADVLTSDVCAKALARFLPGHIHSLLVGLVLLPFIASRGASRWVDALPA